MQDINFAEALGNLSIDKLEAPDDALVTGAVVILEVHHMDGTSHPHLYWSSNAEMTAQTEIGLMTQVLDCMRKRAVKHWEDE